MKSLRLTVLSASVSRTAGGLYTSVRRLSQEIADAGAEVSVSSFANKYTAQDIQAWQPLIPQVFAPRGPSYFSISRDWRRTVLTDCPELIHNHGLWMYPSLICLAAHRRGIPYIISPRGMLDPWAVRNSAWKKRIAGLLFENRHLRHAACLHALCQSEAESIRAYGLTNPIAVIPNGIDVPDWQTERRLDEVRQHPKRPKQLLFLGRIHPKKGLKELLGAWKMVLDAQRHDWPEWQLVIAGWDDGGHEDGLKKQAGSLGLLHEGSTVHSPVHFVGPKFGKEKDQLLREADTFILPSFSEGLPMSVLEAWAYGLPVIMTPQCNIPEGFAAEAAVRIEPTVESIASGLTALFQMTEHQRLEMGQRGRQLVDEKFTWPKIAHQMMSVYEWVLGKGNMPACVITE